MTPPSSPQDIGLPDALEAQNAIACAGVEMRFGDVHAVRGVDLTIGQGELFSLLGPSGCGKTTLLRLIAGLETPTAGRIMLAGHVVAEPDQIVPPEKRRVGLVFQDFALFPHMTVEKNVAYGLPRGLGRKKRVEEMLELARLTDRRKHFPHQLSGGQQQRVALARALAPNPRVVLLDEPFANLDAGLRASVRDEVRALLKTQGVTGVLVTHDQEEALSFSDRVGVMIDGQVAQVGTPREIYERPASHDVAQLFDSGTILPGVADGAAVQCSLGCLPCQQSSVVGPCDVFVRADGLKLTDISKGQAAEVIDVKYFGHDGAATVRTECGTTLRVRLDSEMSVGVGDKVGVRVSGAPVLYPCTVSAKSN